MAVALYARVSTVKQAEKDLSIPDQLKQMRDWCDKNGYTVAMEYVEPGASATDDKRPVFQQMITDATADSEPFEAIIIHSRSRFFRDMFEYLNYERMLKRANCKIISITQQTSDDPAGEMAGKIFSLFDEYQSKENGKHTLRAMKENARRGFMNGSRAPYGYRAVEVDVEGAKGKKKKRIQVDPVESKIVQQIFSMYIHGGESGSMGAKDITTYLNNKNITMRNNKKWTRGRVHEVLSNTAYIGEHYFNKRDSKTKREKPKEEWIKLDIEPIIAVEDFEDARTLRSARAPAKVPPRLVNSPTLLTGLLKCGCCGAGMTTSTGKGGRYKYYKCATRINKNVDQCTAPSISMPKLDNALLSSFADKVFTTERVKALLNELKKKFRDRDSQKTQTLKPLQKEMDEIKQRLDNLYEAVEGGYLPMDDSLRERAQKLKARREAVFVEIAKVKQQSSIPKNLLSHKNVEAFTKTLRAKLLDRNSKLAKDYLRFLIEKITVKGKEVEISGSYEALATAVAQTKVDTQNRVPTFVFVWLPKLGSNQ